MTSHPAESGGAELAQLAAKVIASHEPVEIATERGTVVLVAGEDWRAIEETLYLSAIPGMVESIREGMATPIEDCAEELDW